MDELLRESEQSDYLQGDVEVEVFQYAFGLSLEQVFFEDGDSQEKALSGNVYMGFRLFDVKYEVNVLDSDLV